MLSICATALVVIGILLIIGQVELRRSRAALLAAVSDRNHAIEGFSYACGFLAGQRDMVKAGQLPVVLPPDVDGCEERRAVAARNGFDRP